MYQIIQTEAFVNWLQHLKNREAKSRILARLLRMQCGNLGDIKSVGSGVMEARIHIHGGYRLYFIEKGKTILVMLAGGDKSHQNKDITLAKTLAKEWESL